MRTGSLLCILLLLTGCSADKKRETDLVTFPLRGKVIALDTAALTVTVAHEEIPNYMNAMTMPFHVRDKALLRVLASGDSIQATLAVSRTESWLERISVAGKGEAPRTPSGDELIMAKIFRSGEPIPDETLLNQNGAQIHFGAFRGKVLALTFIYTRCPLPDFCIRMSNQFAEIQKTLTARAGMNGKWHLISISFDPKFDRPPRLKRYAETYGADFSTWDFATDPDTSGPALRRLADGLGLTYAEDQGLIAHNLRTVLIDPEGKLVRVINGNGWTSGAVAAEMSTLSR